MWATMLSVMKTRWVRAIKAHLAASGSWKNKSVNTSSALKSEARLAVKIKLVLYLEEMSLKTTAFKLLWKTIIKKQWGQINIFEKHMSKKKSPDSWPQQKQQRIFFFRQKKANKLPTSFCFLWWFNAPSYLRHWSMLCKSVGATYTPPVSWNELSSDLGSLQVYGGVFS